MRRLPGDQQLIRDMDGGTPAHGVASLLGLSGFFPFFRFRLLQYSVCGLLVTFPSFLRLPRLPLQGCFRTGFDERHRLRLQQFFLQFVLHQLFWFLSLFSLPRIPFANCLFSSFDLALSSPVILRR